MRSYLRLTKSGIVWFVLMSAFIGYAMAVVETGFGDTQDMVLLLLGLYLVSSGSFAINQAQEWQIDKTMPRTLSRPIPAGLLKPWQAYFVGIILVTVGAAALFLLRDVTAILSLVTVLLYNGLYTIHWKRNMSFGAVPGAIPGAMPVVIGYSAAGQSFLAPEAIYLFMIMFLWQMPHFWALAIRYKDDYARAGIPVLPVKLGVDRTLYHMGLYVFTYIGLALAAPWFFKVHVTYVLLVLPISLKVLYEFWRYFQAHGERHWLSFFLWTNFSMLAFIGSPVADRWLARLFF